MTFLYQWIIQLFYTVDSLSILMAIFQVNLG